MEQENLSKEDMERSEKNETAFKTGTEDSRGKEEKTEKIKKVSSSHDAPKRSSSSIDITVKMEKGLDNGIVMYSSKQLSEIRESVASTEWPDFLDEGFKNARGQWDPDRWHQNRKKGSTPPPVEGEKILERRERDSGYATHSASERNSSKSLGIQERPSALSGDLKMKKLADPKERLKAENEGIVLSPQRRSFNTGCQVTQNTNKEEDQERTNHDKSNRQPEKDGEGPARDRNRDIREGHRAERNTYDRGLEKDDMPMSLRGESRRRDGGNEYEDRGRRVGSGRIPMNRIDRDRGLGGEEYGINDRTRNDRIRDSADRNNYSENRDRGNTERRGMPSIERREVGREDERDQLNSRSRFNFQRDRDMDDPRERFRREPESNDGFNRNRGRDWNDSKFKEYDQKRDRGAMNQHNFQITDRDSRIERRDDRNFESDRDTQRYKQGYLADDKFQYGNDSHHSQRYHTSNYGRNIRAGSRYPRRSETEEPEWMSESVQMGELMELRGFDDSPEKESRPSTVNKSGRSEEKKMSNDSITTLVNKDARKEMKHYDYEAIDMDLLLPLDSIPGLANILADDSIDHTSSRENKTEKHEAHNNYDQIKDKIDLKDANKFSAFYQKESKETMKEQNVSNLDQSDRNIEDNILDEGVAPTIDQLRANNSVKSVEELEADIKQMVGISGQVNDPQLSRNDQILNADAHDAGRQFTNKPATIMNKDNTDNQAQTDDMSAFKKFAALMEGKDTEKDGPKAQLCTRDKWMPLNEISNGGDSMRANFSIHLKSVHEERISQGQEPINWQTCPPNYIDEQIPTVPLQKSMNQSDLQYYGENQNLSHLAKQPHAIANPPSRFPTRFPGIDSRDEKLQKMIYYTPSSPHLLEYSESITLLNALNSGQVELMDVIHQFIHGNLPPIRREILLNVLKVAQNQGRLGPIPPGRISPPNFHNLPEYNSMDGNTNQPSNPHLNIHSSSKQPERISPSLAHSPVADPIQMLMQQQGKNNPPQRVSPMLLGVGTQGSGKNTLSVSPVPSQQRVPSPQELRKLEEQKENYRRRNDYQGSGSFRDRSNSDSKSANNPCGDSPLAFTPMSVMKKMAADRRDSDPKAMGNIPELKLSQATSEVPDPQIGHAGDIGRKLPTHGCSNSEEAGTDKIAEQFEDAQQRFGVYQDGRETLQLSSSPSSGIISGHATQISQAVTSPGQLNQMHLQHAAAIQRAQQLQNQWGMNSNNNTRPPPWNMNPLEHHLMMQQHQYGGPIPPNLVGPVSGMGNQFPPRQPNQAFAGISHQQLPLAMPNTGPRPQQMGMPLSMNPHSNAPSYGAAPGNLAKFFSPEVLAQAQSGNAPSMPPLPTQKALTLEEIEHQAATLRI